MHIGCFDSQGCGIVWLLRNCGKLLNLKSLLKNFIYLFIYFKKNLKNHDFLSNCAPILLDIDEKVKRKAMYISLEQTWVYIIPSEIKSLVIS